MLSQGVLSGLPWISQHLYGPILPVPEKGIKWAERALSRWPAGSLPPVALTARAFVTPGAFFYEILPPPK